MKVFAFIFVTIFLIVGTTSSDPEEFEKDFTKWIDECATELEIPEEKLKEYQSMTEPPLEKMATCLTACFLEKAGFMKDDQLQKAMIDEFLKENKDKKEMEGADKIAEKCIKEANENTEKCDVAGALVKCIHNELNIDESAE